MKIVLSGGGTGGHIYPALALRNHILKHYPDAEFLYIGTEKGLESEIVKRFNIPFQSVKVQGIKRSISIENIKTLWYAINSIKQSKKILRHFQPDVVIGTGGYVCGPVLYAASKLNIPTIIHEQNSVAGITNRLLGKYASKICVCFETIYSDFKQYLPKIELTGNPRGQELIESVTDDEALIKLGLSQGKKTVLFFGGSLGAANLNQHILDYYDDYANMTCQFLVVTGKRHYEKIIETVSGKASNRIKIVPYLNNMPDVLKLVDLVVCRSGATTLAELTALGVASVLIPSPYVTNNHQEKNARALVDNGAAKMVLEKELSSTRLVNEVYDIIENDALREKMAIRAKSMGMTDASHRLLKIIEQYVAK